jgi:predicted Na+-dependent transporter
MDTTGSHFNSVTATVMLVLKTGITLSVFAIGLKATVADATFLFRRPAHLLRALLSMNVLMPLTAHAVGAPLDLHPAVKIALVVLSVSPTPPVLRGSRHESDYDVLRRWSRRQGTHSQPVTR